MTSNDYNIKPGSKIYFGEEVKPFTAKAVSDRYVIATKPFNLKKTVWYTIIDFEREVRGPNNLVFNVYDYKNQREIEQCLNDLIQQEEMTDGLQVSHRRKVDLNIIKVVNE
jgi:hypothetical protein